MKREISSINYNWNADSQNVEMFTNRTVGYKYDLIECTKITEHCAEGDGDKWFYDIHYSDGSTVRIFNPNEVFFKPEVKP